MKRLIASLLFILLLIGGLTFGFAQGLKPYPFPFIGRWQPSDDPLLIADYGFQDIQNLRRDGMALKGVSGHSQINATVIDSTYKYPANGFHFKKDQPAESHVVVYSYNASDSAARLYQNTTAIPSTGDFSATVLHTPVAGATLGRFSQGPQGTMLYCDGSESMIWGGDESKCYAFITMTDSMQSTSLSVSDPKDYTEQIQNSLQSNDEIVPVGNRIGVDSDTKLLLHCDGADGSTTFTDSGSTVHVVTANGTAQLDTDQAKFGTASGLFDGNSDYLSAADHADWDIPTDFTIDLWLQISTGGTDYIAIHYEDDDNNWRFLYEGSTSFAYSFNIESGGTDVVHVSGTDNVVDGMWHHAALVKVGNEYGIYSDGAQIAYLSDADTDTFAGLLYIGVYPGGPPMTGYWDGWLDEIRISHSNVFGASPQGDNSDTITVPAAATGSNRLYWLVGSTRPLQGIKYYLSKTNPETATLTVTEWTGNSWDWLTITDNTSGLSSSGTVTLSSWGTASRYLEGSVLYWYQFALSAGGAEIYHVTLDAEFQTIKNIWDGTQDNIGGCKIWDGTTWDDYTEQVLDPNTSSDIRFSTEYDYEDLYEDADATVLAGLLGADSDTVISFSGLSTAHYPVFGFFEPMQGIQIWFNTDSENTVVTTLSAYYWTGEAWQEVTGLYDGTDEGGASFAKTGVISWDPVEKANEFPKAIADELPLYYYKFTFSTETSSEAYAYYVTGIPTTYEILGYSFPAMFQERAFLFNNPHGDKNEAIYSMYNAPDVFNGSDSGKLYFGGDKALTASCVLYNLYQESGVYQMIVTKANETYRLFGDGPENWQVQQMSGNVGCVAPLSMAVCEIADISKDTQRHVAVWQANHGVVMTDGATIKTISDDIRCYWDANDSRYIPASRQDDSVGWYDANTHSYKLLISSGSGQVTHNVELEYSLKYNQWTKIYRENASGANPLQCGFQAEDTDGNFYSYGFTDEGYMYRLENGNTWNDTAAIHQYVQTKDLMLDSGKPFFNDTQVNLFRLIYSAKSTGNGEDIDIAHYCEGQATTHGTNDQFVPEDIDMATEPAFSTQDCWLGRCLYHNFLLTSYTSTVSDGMELIGMGLYYESFEVADVDE